MNIIPISTVVKTDIEILGAIVTRMEDEHTDLTERINAVDQLYRNKSPDLVPHVHDMGVKYSEKFADGYEPGNLRTTKKSKAVKKLYKRLMQLSHPDKVPENVRDRLKEIFLRGIVAYEQNNSATLKLLLDEATKILTLGKLQKLDVDNTLDLRILNDLKRNMEELRTKLVTLKETAMYTILQLHEQGKVDEALHLHRLNLVYQFNDMRSQL